MKCNFIPPHRSDVRRVTHDAGHYGRISKQGVSHTKNWIRSGCMLSTLLFFALSSFASPTLDGVKGQTAQLNHYVPGVSSAQHSLALFNNVFPVLSRDYLLVPLSLSVKNTSSKTSSKREESKTIMIYPDKTDFVPGVNLRAENIINDLLDAPEVKNSKMATGSKDVGHPNKTENFYGNQTLETKYLTPLKINEIKYSNSRYCQGSHRLSQTASFQLIQNLTPQNNLLWPV